jgi:hypothetical protein
MSSGPSWTTVFCVQCHAMLHAPHSPPSRLLPTASTTLRAREPQFNQTAWVSSVLCFERSELIHRSTIRSWCWRPCIVVLAAPTCSSLEGGACGGGRCLVWHGTRKTRPPASSAVKKSWKQAYRISLKNETSFQEGRLALDLVVETELCLTASRCPCLCVDHNVSTRVCCLS